MKQYTGQFDATIKKLIATNKDLFSRLVASKGL
jgi:hypothetical protein